MKKILVLIAIVFAAMQLTAATVDLATAQQSAQRFLMGKAVNGRFMTSAPAVKWTHEVKNSSNAALAAFYIVNTDNGYVIISGDDRAKEILAYGSGSLSSINDLPEAVQYFLNIYQKQMEFLQAHPGMVVQKRFATRGVSVDPLLQTAWAQDKPYNKQCPKVGSAYCKTGCTATSLAQVMRYWEYPKTAPAMDAFQCPKSKINVPALPEYTFDWDNMYDTYYEVDLDRLPQVNEDAIAYLMRYVGQAEHIDYNTDKSGCENPEILQAIQLFGFDEGAHLVKKCDSPDTEEELHQGTWTEEEYYNDEQWGEAIQAELRAGRPLVYCAYDMSSDSTGISGHAFNVDGYDAENDMYHVNFGMSPALNTYYALNAFSTDGWMMVYDFWPVFFAGVQPPGLVTDPRIFATPQEITMSCYAGETTTATFDVSGSNLTGNITVTLNDENGVFTADATTVTLEDVAEGKTVTVTYAPQAVGTHNATITLSSDGAESKVVTLKGVATNAPLVVYDPVMLAADSAYIHLNSFRADWTDQTIAENVASYTLEVNEKPGAGGMLADVDWSTASGQAMDYLPEGWTVGPYSIFFDEGGVAITSGSYIRTNTLDLTGINKVTVVFTAKNYSSWYNSTLTVRTSVDSQDFEFTGSYEEYTAVLDCADNDYVEFYANAYYPTIQTIKIYAGEVSAPQLRAIENGDTAHRLITGITDKFYTVSNLTDAGTYLYKVKAIYQDGTESAWSNVQQVTLFENGPAPHDYVVGDVNHKDGVTIADVSALIDYLLDSENNPVCLICADVNGKDGVTIADVSALIDMLLGM